jgi:hypothetical protein
VTSKADFLHSIPLLEKQAHNIRKSWLLCYTSHIFFDKLKYGNEGPKFLVLYDIKAFNLIGDFLQTVALFETENTTQP